MSKAKSALDVRLKSKLTGKKASRHMLVVFTNQSLELLSGLSSVGAQTDTFASWLTDFAKRCHFNANTNGLLTINQLPDGLQTSADDTKEVKPKHDGVVLVGLNSCEPTKLQKLAASLYKSTSGNTHKLSVLVDGALSKQAFSVFCLAFMNASYRFDKYRQKKTEPLLKQVDFITENTAALKPAFELACATHVGQTQACNLANEPANVCTPEYVAKQALALEKAYPELIKVRVLDQKQMKKLGMGCFLAIAQGSVNEGKLVIIEYTGDKKDSPPIALVGKGITFDTGGISIKPSASMEEMKYDMGGAASVLGTMHALCAAQLPLNVVGALACAENMPSATATRPGDVVTAMDGQTVEIINTDAEGRLVLCDTLVYIKKYKPKYTVDMATLTGACIVAIGNTMSGLFSQDDELANLLLDAGKQAHDRAWRFPMEDDYQELLESSIADMQNIGGRAAGPVTAACFLSRFTKELRWAHLDIAGTAWISGKNKAATGRPIPLLMAFLAGLTQASD